MTASATASAMTSPPSGHDAWREEVDLMCRRHFLLGLDDLPDVPTRAAYDAGESPEEFFRETVVPRLREAHGSFVDELLADDSTDAAG